MRKKYQMKCPHCGYVYIVIGLSTSWEWCPICGFSGKFEEFVIKEEPTEE